ncbi:hypothetical protein CsSME_00022526 [Camellia sinensis var. sinensis]
MDSKESGGGKGGAAQSGGVGISSKGGGTGTGGSGGSGGMMKALGGDGAYISRTGFENDPQGYFSGLHGAPKANNNTNNNK